MAKIIQQQPKKSSYEEILRELAFAQWETQEQRLRRFMKISPQKKLEWLRQMQELRQMTSTKRLKAIRRRLREARQGG